MQQKLRIEISAAKVMQFILSKKNNPESWFMYKMLIYSKIYPFVNNLLQFGFRYFRYRFEKLIDRMIPVKTIRFFLTGWPSCCKRKDGFFLKAIKLFFHKGSDSFCDI